MAWGHVTKRSLGARLTWPGHAFNLAWGYVQRGPGPCLIWPGAVSSTGPVSVPALAGGHVANLAWGLEQLGRKRAISDSAGDRVRAVNVCSAGPTCVLQSWASHCVHVRAPCDLHVVRTHWLQLLACCATHTNWLCGDLPGYLPCLCLGTWT